MRSRTVLIVPVMAAAVAYAQQVDVPNASFEQGDGVPAAWTCQGSGRWLEGNAAAGRHCVAATGTGRDSGAWVSQPLALAPGGAYVLRFRARSLGASDGTATSGPAFCNRDLGTPPAAWTEYVSYFVAPDPLGPEDARLRLGQWQVKGTIAFDDVRLCRAIPVYARRGDVALGAGETVRPEADGGSLYEFVAPLGAGCGNHSRPLARHRCFFNSTRWCLDARSEVVCRHEIAGRLQARAKVDLAVTWHAAGELVVEASSDGKAWTAIGTVVGLGGGTFDVPPGLQPAREVWVRLTARPAGGKGACSLQVSRYAYAARLDGQPLAMVGRTHFLAVPRCDEPLKVEIDDLGDTLPGAPNTVAARITNRTAKEMPGRLMATVVAADGTSTESHSDVVLRPGEQTFRLPYSLAGAGDHALRLHMAGPAEFTAEVALHVAALHDASYGWLLPGGGEAALWWCSSGWKISRTRPAPKAAAEAMVVRAARNEVEAAQLVLRPARDLKGLRAEATALTGPGGATIPAEAVEVLRVRYVPVTQATDATGVVGDWPDPLPPLAAPIDLPAGRNQPLWVRVKVPKGTPAGAYTGSVRLAAEGWRGDAPLRVEVYGFDLPDRMTCTTSLGFNPDNVWRYQGIRDEAQKRAVLAKYLADFSAHHVSPYDPAPLDPFRVTWPKASDWQGGRRDRTDPHGGKACLKVEDTSTSSSVGATYAHRIAIPPGGLRLRFFYRTVAAEHPFIVTLNHHDAGGQWLSGRNRDIRLTGSPQWQAFDVTVKDFPASAKSVRLTLWPCLYSEEGKTTGTVWYDDLSLTDAATGRELVAGGDFEPLPPERLVPELDFTAWDAAMQRAVDQYHFNSFMLHVQGMGGGTFESRTEPSLLGFDANSPEYQAAFTGYCRLLQEHLREKGWLDRAYVYWFDEPDPKDYEFVMNGFRRLKAAAPGLNRMLTEQPEDALAGGPSIWCPITPNYNHEKAEARRKHGERFWWYVCTGPKAPYCTLFIDHPATELRVWLWQTWQRKIDGILVWETTYWTSPTAYTDPSRPQNPYEDPMGWVAGYGTPKGARQPWGNGDGRFLYPPEAAANARPAAPVLDGPVDSIRWEMLRDGVEDYEYLAILRRLLEERGAKMAPENRAKLAALLEVPETITKDMTTFTTTPEPIESRRHAVAKAIESLNSP